MSDVRLTKQQNRILHQLELANLQSLLPKALIARDDAGVRVNQWRNSHPHPTELDRKAANDLYRDFKDKEHIYSGMVARESWLRDRIDSKRQKRGRPRKHT